MVKSLLVTDNLCLLIRGRGVNFSRESVGRNQNKDFPVSFDFMQESRDLARRKVGGGGSLIACLSLSMAICCGECVDSEERVQDREETISASIKRSCGWMESGHEYGSEICEMRGALNVP